MTYAPFSYYRDGLSEERWLRTINDERMKFSTFI